MVSWKLTVSAQEKLEVRDRLEGDENIKETLLMKQSAKINFVN